MIANRTDLAVLKPFRVRRGTPAWRFTIWHGVALVVALIVAYFSPQLRTYPRV